MKSSLFFLKIPPRCRSPSASIICVYNRVSNGLEDTKRVDLPVWQKQDEWERQTLITDISLEQQNHNETLLMLHCSLCLFPSVVSPLVSVCSSFSLSSDTNKHVELFRQYCLGGLWCLISLSLSLSVFVSFSPSSRYRGSESASRRGAGGVSHGVRRPPLPIHRRRRPHQTHTGGNDRRQQSRSSKCQSSWRGS